VVEDFLVRENMNRSNISQQVTKPNKIKKVMKEFKEGKLNIGKSKKKVKNKKQALAIALNQRRV
jgi:hypothetical protein